MILKNMWKNKSEFYPYLSFYLWVMASAALPAMKFDKNHPGLFALGIVAVPTLTLITISLVKTCLEISRGERVQQRFVYQPINKSDDKLTRDKLTRKVWIVLFGIVLLSTYIHHFQPQILNVPDNTDVLSWQNPSFENTLQYDLSSPEQREINIKEGVPRRQNALLFKSEIIMILAALLVLIHSRKYYGKWMTSCFFIGSFVFTGLQETMWILSGRFMGGLFENGMGQEFTGTYWFTKGGFWFFEAPMAACLGWFFIAYTCVLVAGKVFPSMNLWGRAIIGGLMAMSVDLWVDPVLTAPESLGWVWAKYDFLVIFGIPATNFMGWFFLITVFAVIWEKLPGLEERLGRDGATLRFIGICLLADIAVYVLLLVPWVVVAPYILGKLGCNGVFYFPSWW